MPYSFVMEHKSLTIKWNWDVFVLWIDFRVYEQCLFITKFINPTLIKKTLQTKLSSKCQGKRLRSWANQKNFLSLSLPGMHYPQRAVAKFSSKSTLTTLSKIQQQQQEKQDWAENGREALGDRERVQEERKWEKSSSEIRTPISNFQSSTTTFFHFQQPCEYGTSLIFCIFLLGI